jgi:hypothetical protein
MPGSDLRQFAGLVGKTVSAPDDVEVGPQQQQIVAVDFARPLVGYRHGRERRAEYGGAATYSLFPAATGADIAQTPPENWHHTSPFLGRHHPRKRMTQ